MKHKETKIKPDKILFFLISLIYINSIFAQEKIIEGTVIDTITGEHLPYVSIIIKNKKDSIIKYVYSNESGNFSIAYQAKQEGVISFNMIGYKTKTFNLIEFNKPYNNYNFLLKPKTELLSEVVVEGEKQNVVKKIDRDVYTISKQKKANANDIYDILETLPGVIVDKQNNTIRFKGGNPEVLVNNMPATFIYPKLQMISIKDIDNIELIDRSSLYGGEGKGGIINIKLKHKKNNLGAYASTEEDYTPDDKQFSLADNFLNLNYMSKFGMIFNNLNHTLNNSIDKYTTTGTFLSDNINYNKNENNISDIDKLKLTDYCGIYLPSEGFSFLYAFGYRNDNLNNTGIFNQQLTKDDINYDYNLNNRSNNIRNATSLYHLAKIFIKSKDKWEFSTSYTNANVKGNSDFNSNILYFGNFDSTYNYSINEKVKTKTNFVTSYFNYYYNTSSKLNLHFSYLNDQYPQDIYSYYLNNDKYLPLCKSDITGNVNIKTGIGFAKRFGRFSVDATINYKYEKIYGDYIRYINVADTNLNVKLDNHFINPSIRFKQSLNKHNDLYLGYSYTNNLGEATDYLAFIDKQDPNNWYSGNPDLEPEYYHNAYFSYKLTKDSISFSTEIFYKTTLNGITNIHYPVSPQLIITKPENVANNQKVGTDISLWYQITPKISFTINSIISYNLLYTGNLSVNNEEIKREQFNALIKFQPRYIIDNKTGVSLWLDYYPKEIYYYGTIQKPLFAAIAISRKFFNDKLFINLSAGNLFSTFLQKEGTENYMGISTKTKYNETEYKFRFGWYIYYMFNGGDKGTKNIKID